ncbi:hypothetical protein Hanom_Chr08g00705181 [Helianthus anomalus]
MVMSCSLIHPYFNGLQKLKKTNNLLLADCRDLVHLFSYRSLQMWSANCRRFTSKKTNITLYLNNCKQ